MKSKLMKRVLALCLATLMLMAMAAGCGKDKGQPEPATVLTDCTVTVQSEGGMPLANIDVSIYTDKTQSELIDFVRTDENGVAKLNMEIPSGSIIFLSKVPEGYAVDDYYSLTEKNTILSLKATSGSELAPIKLGGVMFDFTVTDQNGAEHTLSKLLESKKAVVLNLWYTTCVPCKMEFPYLQQAYNEYKDDIALLALNPVDDANAIAAFATENGLTMPMAACDPNWANQIDGIAYPTTIVIDRFGTVALIHIGGIDKTATFKNLFAHFVADDYQQATFEDMSSFAAADTDPIGTANNPYVHSGDGSFTVEIEPAQTVYYTLFGADGLHLSANSESLKLVCNDQECTATQGKYNMSLKAAEANGPIMLQLTNTGSKNASFKVSLTAPEGSASKPITMNDDAVTVTLSEGNQQGVYYEYKTHSEGTFTVKMDNDVDCIVTIRNLSGKETATLDKNTKKATINVRKNDEIQIIVIAVEQNGQYPAAEVQLSVANEKVETPTTTNTQATNASTSTTKADGSTTNKTGNSTTAQSTASATTGKTSGSTATKPTSTTAGKTSGSTTTSKTENSKTTTTGTTSTTGKLVNPDAPIEFGSVLNFDAEVNTGEMVLYHVFRVSGTTLHIKDSTAYVIYGDKTYKPDKNGNIYIPVVSDSPINPIVLKIGNSGNTNKTYAVKFTYPEGSMMNPYKLKAGNIKTKIEADNEQGVYYNCVAEKDGQMTIVLKGITKGVECDIRVTVVDIDFIPHQYLLSETDDGKTLTIDIYEGDEIEINIVALPDENFKYPAATIDFAVSFS